MSVETTRVLDESERTDAVKQRPALLTLLRSDPVPSRRRSFTLGFLLQIILLVVLIRIGTYAPKLVLRQPHESVQLIAPVLPPPVARPAPHLVAPRISKPVMHPVEAPKIAPPPVVAKLEPPKQLPMPEPARPKLVPPKPAPPVPVRHVVVNSFETPKTVAQAAPPKPEVKTNVFAGSSVTPTVKAPVQKVQTGGFGNPVGVKGSTTEMAKLNAPKLGSFDMPSGPGNGNGLDGSNGTPGVVKSAGFGSSVAANGNHDVAGQVVHPGGFGSASTVTAGPSLAKKNLPAALVPVQILAKPQPQYTKEARALKIQGEVHLKVVFQSDGHVRVLRVVQGLGHGLDQAAMAAAEKIKFKPAMRHGRPCDMTATVHIVFQLAS